MKSALVLCACLLGLPTARAADYSELPSRLEPVVQEEMREWGITGIAIALVDDGRVVYEKAFGEARPDSLFRVGSISKLFNAIAVMQQVEAGKLDLDAPLPPEVLPINPFPGEPKVTLRQLLCHRSGLQREPIVGHYLDPSEPGLERTVQSVPSGVLVTLPEEKVRYSNLGPSIAGYLVQRAAGMPFEKYQHERVLGPLGMDSAGWLIEEVDRGKIVPAYMRVADGRGGFTRREAPLFNLGTIPAGNLFATAGGLAKFASVLMAGGAPLLEPESLEAMWEPQFTTDAAGFGLGFLAGDYRGRRIISHGGAVYGYSTSLMMLPEEHLAAIVLANEDIAGGRVSRVTRRALDLLLNAKFDEPLPEAPPAFADGRLERFTGDYESQSYWARLEVREGRLVGNLSGQPTRFWRRSELGFAADSRLHNAAPATFEGDEEGTIIGFRLGGQHYRRVPPEPKPLPEVWRAFLGSYGEEFIPIIISERHGHLYAMTENMVDYRLTPVNRNVCSLPPGMYVDEEVVFLTGRDGDVHAINFANMLFPRRR